MTSVSSKMSFLRNQSFKEAAVKMFVHCHQSFVNKWIYWASAVCNKDEGHNIMDASPLYALALPWSSQNSLSFMSCCSCWWFHVTFLRKEQREEEMKVWIPTRAIRRGRMQQLKWQPQESNWVVCDLKHEYACCLNLVKCDLYSIT